MNMNIIYSLCVNSGGHKWTWKYNTGLSTHRTGKIWKFCWLRYVYDIWGCPLTSLVLLKWSHLESTEIESKVTCKSQIGLGHIMVVMLSFRKFNVCPQSTGISWILRFSSVLFSILGWINLRDEWRALNWRNAMYMKLFLHLFVRGALCVTSCVDFRNLFGNFICLKTSFGICLFMTAWINFKAASVISWRGVLTPIFLQIQLFFVLMGNGWL